MYNIFVCALAIQTTVKNAAQKVCCKRLQLSDERRARCFNVAAFIIDQHLGTIYERHSHLSSGCGRATARGSGLDEKT